MSFPPVPKEVKPVAHLLKVADEHESRNIVVAYWARMAACRLTLSIVQGNRPKPVSDLVSAILLWLEETKSKYSDVEGMNSEAAAQAIIEEYALQIFDRADKLDRDEIYDKNTVKMFYMAGMLFDVCEQFGLSDDLNEKRKYAKWKASYIHNCLKNGDRPLPGDRENTGIVHFTELDDDHRARYEAEDAKENPAPFVPPPNPESFAPAPASSPVTPSIQPTPAPFSIPAPVPSPVMPVVPPPALLTPTGGATLTPDQMQKAQKYCKYATSALNYDDTKTAIENLTKALNLLQTGREA